MNWESQTVLAWTWFLSSSVTMTQLFVIYMMTEGSMFSI